MTLKSYMHQALIHVLKNKKLEVLFFKLGKLFNFF
jgi:hypothetical protein